MGVSPEIVNVEVGREKKCAKNHGKEKNLKKGTVVSVGNSVIKYNMLCYLKIHAIPR